MAKLTAQQKAKIRSAKKTIQEVADILQGIQDECDTANAAILEEIGISLGFCIDQIEQHF